MIIKRCDKIATKDKQGKPNGFLVTIFNPHDGVVAEPDYPKQVYMTVIAPGTVKGPHLHHKRCSLFTCVQGNMVVVIRTAEGYREYESGDDHGYAMIRVPGGTPAALYNPHAVEARVLTLASHAWNKADPDDYPVTFDDYVFKR